MNDDTQKPEPAPAAVFQVHLQATAEGEDPRLLATFRLMETEIVLDLEPEFAPAYGEVATQAPAEVMAMLSRAPNAEARAAMLEGMAGGFSAQASVAHRCEAYLSIPDVGMLRLYRAGWGVPIPEAN